MLLMMGDTKICLEPSEVHIELKHCPRVFFGFLLGKPQETFTGGMKSLFLSYSGLNFSTAAARYSSLVMIVVGLVSQELSSHDFKFCQVFDPSSFTCGFIFVGYDH